MPRTPPPRSAANMRRIPVTDAEVLARIDAGATQRALAAEYGVSRAAVVQAADRARSTAEADQAAASQRRVQEAARANLAEALPQTEAVIRTQFTKPVFGGLGVVIRNGEEETMGTAVSDLAIARALWRSGPWPPYDGNAVLHGQALFDQARGSFKHYTSTDLGFHAIWQRESLLQRYLGALARFGYLQTYVDDHGRWMLWEIPGYLGVYWMPPHPTEGPYGSIELDLKPILRLVKHDARATGTWDSPYSYAPVEAPPPPRRKVAEYTIGDGY